MAQLDLYGPPRHRPPVQDDGTPWTEVIWDGRRYRWRLLDEPDDLVEWWDEHAEAWIPPRRFQLEFVADDGTWRTVRFWTRRVQIWALVRPPQPEGEA